MCLGLSGALLWSCLFRTPLWIWKENVLGLVCLGFFFPHFFSQKLTAFLVWYTNVRNNMCKKWQMLAVMLRHSLSCSSLQNGTESFDVADVSCDPWGSFVHSVVVCLLEGLCSDLITHTHPRASWFHRHVKTSHAIWDFSGDNTSANCCSDGECTGTEMESRVVLIQHKLRLCQ